MQGEKNYGFHQICASKIITCLFYFALASFLDGTSDDIADGCVLSLDFDALHLLCTTVVGDSESGAYNEHLIG